MRCATGASRSPSRRALWRRALDRTARRALAGLARAALGAGQRTGRARGTTTTPSRSGGWGTWPPAKRSPKRGRGGRRKGAAGIAAGCSSKTARRGRGAGRHRADRARAGETSPHSRGRARSHGATSIAKVRTAGASTRRALVCGLPAQWDALLNNASSSTWNWPNALPGAPPAAKPEPGGIPPGKDARRNARLPMAASVPEGAGRTGGGPDTLPVFRRSRPDAARGDEPPPRPESGRMFAARQPFAPRPKAAKRRLKRATCPSVSTMRRPPPVHAG